MNARLIYQVLLHCLLVVLLFKTDTYTRLSEWSGLVTHNVYNTPFYQSTMTHQLRQDAIVQADTLVFFGDSLLHGLNTNSVTHNSLNFAIAGETSADLLQRFSYYRAANQSKKLVIGVGINDIGKIPTSEIVNQITRLLQLPQKTTTVYFLGLLPIGHEHQQRLTKNQSDINNVNVAMQLHCQQSKQCIYIAPPSLLIDKKGMLEKRYHRGDGLHLNKEGYKVWSSYLHDQLLIE